MTEFVRVKDPKTGHEYTAPKRFAESSDLEIIDRPATNTDGRHLAAKPKVNLPSVNQTTSSTAGMNPVAYDANTIGDEEE